MCGRDCSAVSAPPMRAGLTGNPSSNRMTSLWRQRAGFVSLPYSSLLTYPGGAPIRRATEGCSMNSLLTMQTLARAFGTSQSAAPCGDAAFQFFGIRGYVSCERERGGAIVFRPSPKRVPSCVHEKHTEYIVSASPQTGLCSKEMIMYGHALRPFLGIVCILSSMAVLTMMPPGNRMSLNHEMSLTGGGSICDGYTSCYACTPPNCMPTWSSYSGYYCGCSGGADGCATFGGMRFCTPNKPGTCVDGSGGAACGGAATKTNLPTTNIGSTTVNQIKIWYCTNAAGESTEVGTCNGTGAASTGCQTCI